MAQTETAVFAGGCFWGVEHLFKDMPGVKELQVGYTGGSLSNPSYKQVCTHTTGHAEALRIVFDPEIVSFETLAKHFFEIHDPTQSNGQGPDIGPQYRSAVFYTTPSQRDIALRLINILKEKGFKVVTQVLALETFWPAEEYHQHYYVKKGAAPYCHRRVKRF